MEVLTQLLATGDRVALARGRVVAFAQGTVVVAIPGREAETCDVLETNTVPSLAQGDVVLVWLPSSPDERGVVLGRVAAAPHPESAEPDDLLIEAEKSLTLKCGDGSITIREDGKILIKGKDLVSHATRMNRIKGGAVQIN